VAVSTTRDVSTDARILAIRASLFTFLLMSAIGCNPGPPFALKFGDLTKADKIEAGMDKMYVITERPQIEAAAQFFERYRDGWTTVPSGGGGPLYIRFLQDGHDIGTFTVGEVYLAVGASVRRPPQEEITTMVRGLGLTWPRPK
jgi:hypothetical protein